MSDQDQNLKVVTGHLTHLATSQLRAADLVTGANRTTADVAANIISSHGLVCSATSVAVSMAETARKTAGTQLNKVSTELSAKLTTAATNYDDVDYREGRSLGQACQV
jgi:hypothetical protein